MNTLAHVTPSGSVPISFSFAVSNGYAQHLAVVLTSILVHNPRSSFVFHVLHCDISPENRAKIKELENFWRHGREAGGVPEIRVAFHEVDIGRFDEFRIPVGLEHITKEMFFRYLLPEVLVDEGRTIYSDVDVLCVGDVRELWETDLQGNPVAAVRYEAGTPGFAEFKRSLGLPPDSEYYASGLLVMDLDAMRRDGSVKKLFDATDRLRNVVVWPDMDVINAVFNGRFTPIDAIWNCIDRYSSRRKDVRIWHFPGFTTKPWCNIWKNTTWPVYLKYLRKSPYRANAGRFVWGHLKGALYFKYVKKGVERTLVCGIRVRKRKI